MKKLIILILLFVISSCAKEMNIDKFVNNKPELILEDYFDGKVEAWGLFHDRFGNLKRQFKVSIIGTRKEYNPSIFENVINNPKLINTDTKIGKNVVILDGYIQPKAIIGDNTFIWSSSVIGHHTKLGNHCWISSGVTIGGNCEIKDYSFFGMNATIGHFVKVDKSCFIGSSTHITKNVKKESVIINPDSKIIPFNAKKFLKIKKFK